MTTERHKQQHPELQPPAWGERAESLFQQIIERIESDGITGDEVDHHE